VSKHSRQMISSHPTQIETGSFETPVCPQYAHGFTSFAHSAQIMSSESKINLRFSLRLHPSHRPQTVATPGSLDPIVSTVVLLHGAGLHRKHGGT
jgi:hypothetical protein